MHHDYAESVYGKKIAWAAAEVARALAHDAPEPYGEPAFIMEWGSGYWSHTDRDGADMSDPVVEAAARDGVRLDPRAGFGPAEKDRFFTDNARYHDEQTVHYRRALGHTPIRITPQGAQLPDSQYLNALYTHTVQAVLYPSFDDRHPAWVSGMGDRMWASSEMYAFTDPWHYEYGCANSRLACANLEVTMLDAAGKARSKVDHICYKAEVYRTRRARPAAKSIGGGAVRQRAGRVLAGAGAAGQLAEHEIKHLKAPQNRDFLTGRRTIGSAACALFLDVAK